MLGHIALDLDTSAEKLAGMIVAEVVAKARDNPESLRRLMPKPK